MRTKLIALVGAALMLTGCAGGATGYDSPEALQEAYVEAGGECANSTDLPESMVSEGAHSILCEDLSMLIVFDSTEAKDRYVARTGDSEQERVSGERWLVSGENVAELAGALGGTAG